MACVNGRVIWVIKEFRFPTLDKHIIDLDLASESDTYCDEFKGRINSYGLEITELSTHIQGQLVAVHPAHDIMFDVFAPKNIKGKYKDRTAWATDQMKKAAIVSNKLDLTSHATFFGFIAVACYASLATTTSWFNRPWF